MMRLGQQLGRWQRVARTVRCSRPFLWGSAMLLLLLVGNSLWFSKDNNQLLQDFLLNYNLHGNATASRPGVAVFYNLFLPRGNLPHAQTIYKEQIRAVVAASSANKRTRMTLFYNTIQDASRLPHIARQCTTAQSLDCVHLGHHDEGNEAVTLQALYEYCQQRLVGDDKEDDTTVIYMHSKGTYTSSRDRDIWRQNMGQAVLHPQCTSALLHHGQCNVCGMLFHPVYAMYFPGNFFAAKCSYVRQLIPPRDFETAMNAMHAALDNTTHEPPPPDKESSTTTTQQLPAQPWLRRTLYHITPDSIGTDRWAMEHWITSHPTVRPCDFGSQSIELHYWLQEKRDLTDQDFVAAAPSQDIWAKWYHTSHRQDRLRALLQNKAELRREAFLLPGHLFRWYYLYRDVPPSDSWLWRWFPDGDYWKDQVEGQGLPGAIPAWK